MISHIHVKDNRTFHVDTPTCRRPVETPGGVIVNYCVLPFGHPGACVPPGKEMTPGCSKTPGCGLPAGHKTSCTKGRRA